MELPQAFANAAKYKECRFPPALPPDAPRFFGVAPVLHIAFVVGAFSLFDFRGDFVDFREGEVEAAFGDFDSREPRGGVDDKPREVRVGENPDSVSARAAESARAVGVFAEPENRLVAPEVLADERVARVRPEPALAHVVGRRDDSERRYLLPAVFGEFHIEVPFVVDFEGVDAACRRVVGEFFKVGVEVRVHRPMGLVVPADERVEDFDLPRVVFAEHKRVVEEPEARARVVELL